MRTASTPRTTHTPPRPWRVRGCLAAFALAILAWPSLAQQISSHVIAAGGGSSRSPGGCRVLEGTMGQAVVGTSSGGAFSVRAGYWAGPGSQRRDSIFSGDFEECD